LDIVGSLDSFKIIALFEISLKHAKAASDNVSLIWEFTPIA
jgi:hypothetical protein